MILCAMKIFLLTYLLTYLLEHKMSTSSSDAALNTCAVNSFAKVHVVSLKHDKQINEISGSIQ